MGRWDCGVERRSRQRVAIYQGAFKMNKDWPRCEKCGRNLVYIIPNEGQRPFYGCYCGHNTPPSQLGSEVENRPGNQDNDISHNVRRESE